MEETEEIKKKSIRQVLAPALLVVGIMAAGVLTGFFLAKPGVIPGSALTAPTLKKGKEVGSPDIKTFKDTATGIIEKNGIDGEGTHKLIREGGPSQTAYLTSSIIDLDQFVGKKVQVWGETFKGQKAGWLMDVGRVKILE
ncbi:MAG: hypothetical protein ACOZBZ_01330 [Patescibacteria group bacterium]